MTSVACAGNATGGAVFYPKGHRLYGKSTAATKGIPIKVYNDLDLGDGGNAIEAAISSFPCPLFTIVEDPFEADIIVRDGLLGGTSAGRMVMDEGPNHYLLVDFTVAPIFNSTAMYLLLAHELGHALGLAHDRRGIDGHWISIMAPDAMKHADRLEEGKLLPWLYPGDKKAIKSKWCR